jgi:hypothetical protein
MRDEKIQFVSLWSRHEVWTTAVSIRKEMKSVWVISGFRRHVNGTCALFLTKWVYIKENLRKKPINSDTVLSILHNQIIPKYDGERSLR